MPSIEELCDALLAARDARDAAKAALDRADETYGAAEKALVDAMVDVGQDKATHAGMTFATKHKVSWKAAPAEQDGLIRVLRAEAPEVVKETVHAATLTKFMNEHEQEYGDGGPGWWKQVLHMVKRSEATVLSLTKSRKKT
jgi:hypothetical protein